jgi:hypothetical protein
MGRKLSSQIHSSHLLSSPIKTSSRYLSCIVAYLSTVMALEGRLLFTAVTSLTCLGFLLIGYDNGLMGG